MKLGSEEHKQFTQAIKDIRDDLTEMLDTLLTSTSEEELTGTLLEANFMINAWGMASRAYDTCLDKYQRGEEFDAQDELIHQAVTLKAKEMGTEKKVF